MRDLESWLLAYLLNSVWQVPLIFTVALLLSRTLRSIGAAIEHRIWVMALLLQTLLPALSAQSLQRFGAFLLLRKPGSGLENAGVSVIMGAGTGVGNLRLTADLSLMITASYTLVLLYFAARLTWGIWITFATQQAAKRPPLPLTAIACWENCCHAFGLRDAHIAISNRIAGPMTMGLLRGIVLLPEDMIERFSEDDLQAVFSHELAHIHRRDFAKNLVYELLALPASYHPVSWLTRARLVESREVVCDEIAAEMGLGRQKYARSLLRLASMLVQRTSANVPHAIGIFDANTLERRIMKLANGRIEIRGMRRIATLAICVMCGLGTCVSAMALHASVYPGHADGAGKSEENSKTSTHVPAAVMAGQVISKVTPVYPQAAKDAKIEGHVVLRAIIGKDGKIENLQVQSGPRELMSSALDAVRQWIYKPYLLNGEPTEVETNITVNYSLAK